LSIAQPITQVARWNASQAIKAATKGLPAFEAICVGHVIRYLWRYRVKHEKNPLVDVKKSVFYLNELIAEIENLERK
jgi:hypothetical protein